MKYIILIAILFFAPELHAQQLMQQVPITGIVVGNDSLPISDVAIVNIRTGKTVRTNAAGYFTAVITGNDSLFVYHISYKKRYITQKDDGRLIVLEPEIQELRQVDVNDKSKQEQKNLAATIDDILRLAPMKTLTGYDLHSRQDYFILENGSQTRGFSPFFGPTAHIPLEKVTGLVIKTNDEKERKKLTSHYKLMKKKNNESGEEEPQKE